MLIRINGNPLDTLNDFADKFISKESDIFFKPIRDSLHEGLVAFLTNINANSVELITLGIVICAGGMMIAPLMGSRASKWLGRLVAVFWAGVTWRVLIT